MKLSALCAVSSVVASLFLAPALATPASAAAPPVTPGAFKLYGKPHVTPSPYCDLHTTLTIDAGGTARLATAVAGTCDIAAIPDPRQYSLALASEACGSKVYTGRFVTAGKAHAITVTDHRARTCQDVVPARVVVTETRPTPSGSATFTLYSAD